MARCSTVLHEDYLLIDTKSASKLENKCKQVWLRKQASFSFYTLATT
jgi:hypothetical protein